MRQRLPKEAEIISSNNIKVKDEVLITLKEKYIQS